jgi:hypothetical protein
MIPARGLTTVKVRVADPFHAPCVLSQTSYVFLRNSAVDLGAEAVPIRGGNAGVK